MLRLYPLFGLIAALLSGAPASAIAVLDLNTGLCHNQTECTLSLNGAGQGGALATFSAPEVTLGTDDFFAFSGGMVFGSSVFPHAFDLSFTRTVQWSGGSLSMAHRFEGFSITGPTTAVSGLLANNSAGAFSFDNPLQFQENQTYRFETEESDDFSFAVLDDLRFSGFEADSAPSVVPLPATLPLMLAMLFGIGLIEIRRRYSATSVSP